MEIYDPFLPDLLQNTFNEDNFIFKDGKNNLRDKNLSEVYKYYTNSFIRNKVLIYI